MWQCSISKLGFVGPKWQRKIYNVALWAWGGRLCCGLRDGTGLMVSWALGHRRIREDDSTAGPGMARVDGITSSGMAPSAQRRELGRTTLLWAQERRHGLGDSACVVDGITDSGQGRWWNVKGLDRGREWQHGGSGEDSTTAWRLQGGFDNDMYSRAIDDSADSREIFDKKFWQPDGVCESLQRLGFAKTTQRIIYRRITVATGISDVHRAIATENHSSNRRLPSSAHC
jgi:hypothetical protein